MAKIVYYGPRQGLYLSVIFTKFLRGSLGAELVLDERLQDADQTNIMVFHTADYGVSIRH